MPIHLVDGDYRLHVLADEGAFRAYVTGRPDLKLSNMLELLGIFSEKRVGTDTKYKQKHMLLRDVVWLTFGDESQIVPLVGSPQEMYQRLQAQHGIRFAYPTVRDLLNNSKPRIKDKDGRIWRKTHQPASVANLRHGDSILEALPSEVTTTIYPSDFDGNVRRL